MAFPLLQVLTFTALIVFTCVLFEGRPWLIRRFHISSAAYNALIAADFIVLVLLMFLVKARTRKQMKAYSGSKGLEFQERIDPLQFDLYETTFFGRFDMAADAASGAKSGVNFIYFLHHRAGGRGQKALVRPVVGFELQLDQGTGKAPAPETGWSADESTSHVFFWRDEERPTLNMDEFVDAAFAIYQSRYQQPR